MAEILLFEEQLLEPFSQNSDFGVYWFPVAKQFSLTVGETYRVLWGDNAYTCTAVDASAINGGAAMVAIGNGTGFGLPGNGEPFAICTTDSDMIFWVIDPADTSASHKVEVYQITADEDTGGEDSEQPEEPTTEGASIVLKDRNGEDVTYTGIKTVTFDTPEEGKQATFSLGVVAPKLEIPVTFADGNMPITADENTLIKEMVLLKPDTLVPENIRAGVNVAAVTGEFIGDTEEATVELSMTDGDQTVTPSAEGKVLSKVTITKPETLIPENIAEGVDIAGIIGTLAAGSSVKIESGTINGNNGALTITHGLGVVPDIIFVANPSSAMGTGKHVVVRAFGISNAFRKAIGHGWQLQFGVVEYSPSGSSLSSLGITGNSAIDSTSTGTSSLILNANADTFVLGNATYVTYSASTYYWYAIGGLT